MPRRTTEWPPLQFGKVNRTTPSNRLSLYEAIGVSQRGDDVGIEQCVASDSRGRRDGPDHGADEHRALTLACQHCVEEILAMMSGARHDVAFAGDDLQRLHVVDLGAVGIRSRADAADRQRAADAELDVVGNDRRRGTLLQRLQQHCAPRTASVGEHPRAGEIGRAFASVLIAMTMPPSANDCP